MERIRDTNRNICLLTNKCTAKILFALSSPSPMSPFTSGLFLWFCGAGFRSAPHTIFMSRCDQLVMWVYRKMSPFPTLPVNGEGAHFPPLTGGLRGGMEHTFSSFVVINRSWRFIGKAFGRQRQCCFCHCLWYYRAAKTPRM